MEDEFSDYLRQITKDNTDYQQKAGLQFDNLFENDISDNELNHNSTINNALLTFNYTQPNFEEKTFKSKIYYSRNVHGNIKDNNIIMGIDYESDDKEHSLVRFTKTYRTLAFTHIQHHDHSLFDHSLDKIKIYGHSLNSADKSYFYAIFDAIDLYGQKTELYFYYSDYDGFDEDALFQNINRLIQGYGETISKDHGKSLLHKLILGGRIHIKELFEYYHLDEKSATESETKQFNKHFARIHQILLNPGPHATFVSFDKLRTHT
ncbi:AbiH family protein [Oenococcus alcoholitolerans]